MHRVTFAGLAGLGILSWLAAARATDLGEVYPGCSGPAACCACEPACKATWEEKKSSKPRYSMKCEHACARGRDPWHAPPPECRCCPPCGNAYVKKRLYKADGCEKVERVPKYEVVMVPAAPCDCPACRGCGPLGWLNPLRLFH